jgi:hypothetical protein
MLPSRTDLLQVGRQYVISRARRIEPTQVDVEGSDINLVIGSTSYVAHNIVRKLGEEINGLLLDGCDTDDAIDRLAFDRYEQLRKGAAAAVGAVQFSRPTNLAGLGTVPIGTKLLTLTGIEYFTTSVANFAATGPSSLTATANVRAAQAGKDFQAGRNAIRRFDNVGALWDPTLVVNNADPTAGGEPVETIDAFRERVRAFFVGSKRGTLAAIEFGAKQVPGVDSAEAVEALESDLTPARIVRLFIADSSGIASAALALLVRTVLNEYRAGGIQVIVETSSPVIVPISLRLSFRAGVDTVTLRDQVQGAVVEFINSLGVNKPLQISALYSVLARFRSDGLFVNQGTIVAPTGDVYPEPGFTLRTTPSSVTILES